MSEIVHLVGLYYKNLFLLCTFVSNTSQLRYFFAAKKVSTAEDGSRLEHGN